MYFKTAGDKKVFLLENRIAWINLGFISKQALSQQTHHLDSKIIPPTDF